MSTDRHYVIEPDEDDPRFATEEVVVFGPEFPGRYQRGHRLALEDVGMGVTEARERIRDLNLPLKIRAGGRAREPEVQADVAAPSVEETGVPLPDETENPSQEGGS